MTFSLNQQPNRTPKTYSYLRVSQVTQDLEKDKMSILKLANDLELGNVVFYEEKTSGRISWKERKISEIIELAQAGDNLIVAEISRLGRSLLEVVEILSICSRKEVNVFSVKGSWRLDGSMQSKIIATVLAICSEVERSLISERTKNALMVKKLNGVKLGRPVGSGSSKLDKYAIEIHSLLKNGSTKQFISKRYGCTPANLYHWLERHPS